MLDLFWLLLKIGVAVAAAVLIYLFMAQVDRELLAQRPPARPE